MNWAICCSFFANPSHHNFFPQFKPLLRLPLLVLLLLLINFARVSLQDILWVFNWLFVGYYNLSSISRQLKNGFKALEILDGLIHCVVVLDAADLVELQPLNRLCQAFLVTISFLHFFKVSSILCRLFLQYLPYLRRSLQFFHEKWGRHWLLFVAGARPRHFT